MFGDGKLRRHSIFLLVILSVASLLYWRSRKSYLESRKLDRALVSQSLAPSFQKLEFPLKVELLLPGTEKVQRAEVEYSLDAQMQSEVEDLLHNFKPDYGAIVAIEPKSGKILAMTSYSRERKNMGNLVLRATFPAASIFKMVTATAAIDANHMNPNTVVAFNGRSHTLYRRNVEKTEHNRWTRYITLREAFGKSVNTVFAKVGIFYVGPQNLLSYAERFFFNRALPGDLPVERGIASVPEGDKWALAETSSGFTRETTMSPLQGALMAAAVVNEGVMMEPTLIQSLKDESGEIFYQAEAKVLSVTMSKESSYMLRELMQETVESGTSRKSFRQVLGLRKFKNWDFGGKTGSLQGRDPKGKYDWFVGYATRGKTNEKIAIAALTINEDRWRVKSSYLAGKFLETYLRRFEKSRAVAYSDQSPR